MKLLGYNDGEPRLCTFQYGKSEHQKWSPQVHIYVQDGDVFKMVTLYFEYRKDYYDIKKSIVSEVTEVIDVPTYKFAIEDGWDLNVTTGIATHSDGRASAVFTLGDCTEYAGLTSRISLFHRNRNFSTNGEQLFEILGFTESYISEDNIDYEHITMWFKDGETIRYETTMVTARPSDTGYGNCSELDIFSGTGNLPELDWIPAEEGLTVSLPVKNGQPFLYSSDILLLYKDGVEYEELWEYEEAPDKYYPSGSSEVSFSKFKLFK